MGVGDDQGVAAGQRGDHGEVGVVAGGQHERRRLAEEVGQLVLDLGVQAGGAGDQAGRAGAGAPLVGGLGGGPHDVGVAGEAEVVVAGQVEDVRRPGACGTSRRVSPASSRARACSASHVGPGHPATAAAPIAVVMVAISSSVQT